ncbi:MAG: hypothetical protein ABI405_14225 [Parafilimonas sp.]
MLETKWEIDADEGKGWSYKPVGSLFSKFKTNPLEEELIKMLSKSDKVYNGDVYVHALRLGFLPTHCNEVFTSLQSQGKLDVLSDNNEKIRKGAYYISYDNYKNNYSKVFYKVK